RLISQLNRTSYLAPPSSAAGRGRTTGRSLDVGAQVAAGAHTLSWVVRLPITESLGLLCNVKIEGGGTMSTPAGAGHALPANRRIRILFAALLTVLPPLAATGGRTGRAEGAYLPTLRPPGGINGPLVALHTPGGMGGSGEILEVQQGRVA